MRLIICGGRAFDDHELFYTAVTDWIATHGRPTEVITGGAPGADTIGHAWATTEVIPTRVFPADWAAHGRAAGPRRNAQMAAHAAQGQGGCLALPGGQGTADMVRQARAVGLTVPTIEGENIDPEA